MYIFQLLLLLIIKTIISLENKYY